MNKRALILSAISGVLIGLSYIPFFPVFGLVAIVPLWVAVDQARSMKQVLLYSWISQFVFSLIGFYWIAFTAHEFGFMPWWLSILVLIGFCSIIHLHFLIGAGLYFWMKKRFLLSSLEGDFAKLCLFFLAESYWPMLFPWNFGYSWMSSALPLKQTAEIWGFTGISFFVLLANVFVKQVYELRKDRAYPEAKKYIFALLVCFICFNLAGSWLQSRIPAYDKLWNIGIVQANIGNLDKVRAETSSNYQEVILQRYFKLTEELVAKDSKLDLIVWPETALPFVVSPWNQSNYLYKQFIAGTKKLGTPLLTGGFLSDKRPYNAALMISPEGVITDRYKKNLLLAWGETVPFTDPYPELQDKLKKILPALSFFGQGDGPRITIWKDLKIGINICYEAIHPLFMAKLKQKDANVLVNLTNDSWFGDTSEPIQHMYMTMARAIELRVPVVRSTNTGISSVALANGEILERSPINKKWLGTYEIPGHETAPVTVYQRAAPLVPGILVLITLLITLHRKWKGAKKYHDQKL